MPHTLVKPFINLLPFDISSNPPIFSFFQFTISQKCLRFQQLQRRRGRRRRIQRRKSLRHGHASKPQWQQQQQSRINDIQVLLCFAPPRLTIAIRSFVVAIVCIVAGVHAISIRFHGTNQANLITKPFELILPVTK